MQQRLRKFIRQPERFDRRQVTNKSLEIVAAIERYRFVPSSLLVRLVPGGIRNNHRHLQTLFHKSIINRFALPKYGGPSEFIYYLDTSEALKLIIDAGLIRPTTAQRHRKEQLLWANREKDYASLHRDPDVQGKLLFIHHELMVSRFHGMLELGCRASDGQVELTEFRQGPELYARLEVPKLRYDNNGQLVELEDLERLPHRPDAFFTLRFTTKPESQQLSHFFYEADRGTETTTRFKTKLRAHWHFVVKQQLHKRPPYTVRSIRAVLVESTDMHWAHNLREAAKHPSISSRPSPLFWFTTSELFMKPVHTAAARPIPLYLADPKFIFSRIWASPAADTFLALYE